MDDSQENSESTESKHKINSEDYIRKYRCDNCGSRFATRENLDSHSIIHQSDAIIKCTICEKHFDTVQGLFIFSFLFCCGDAFSYQKFVFDCIGLMAHNVVHTEKKFKCQLCDVWFKMSGNLKEHMKIHKGLVFKCQYCGKDFNKIGNLRIHEMRHTKSLKQFQCDLCPRLDNFYHDYYCVYHHYSMCQPTFFFCQNFHPEMPGQISYEDP